MIAIQSSKKNVRFTGIPRLGVNIDHIATLRQLRGTPYPSVLEAAQIAETSGADQITVHLREDRRHIQDEDVKLLRAELKVPLNLETAVTPERIAFARRILPDWACFVPEKRQELTTEGGLDIKKIESKVGKAIAELKKQKVKVSLFIEPSLSMVKLAKKLGADAVELHTGEYARAHLETREPSSKKLTQSRFKKEMARLEEAGRLAASLGVHAHAGHGLDLYSVRPLIELDVFEEYNIGHSIICRAAIVGLEQAVREMLSAITAP
jgi:pyridoxine 5-phosphate synthase